MRWDIHLLGALVAGTLLVTGCLEEHPAWRDAAEAGDGSTQSGSGESTDLPSESSDGESSDGESSGGESSGGESSSGESSSGESSSGESSSDGGTDTDSDSDGTSGCVAEICNGTDDDCDGLVDEVSSANQACNGCQLEQFAGQAHWFCTARLDWSSARQACLDLGADLIVLQDVDHHDFVAGHQPLNGGTFDDNIWIGLHDRDTEGTFEWVDGSALTFTEWANGEPNNSSGLEDCAEFFENEASAWNDLDCQRVRSSVCAAPHEE